jgi:hypothetical protein
MLLLQDSPSGSADFCKRIETYLAEWQQDLAILESGGIGLGQEGVVTAALIALHKRIIGRYRAILTELEKDSLNGAN